MNSMTGFGRGTAEADGLFCTVELKTVNSRFCDITIKAPRQLAVAEDVLRNAVQKRLHRGKVEISVSLLEKGNRPKSFSVNRLLKEQIQDMLIEEGFFTDRASVPLEAVMSISSDWIQAYDEMVADSVLRDLIETAVTEAVSGLLIMRSREGTLIQTDLLSRLATLTTLVGEINKHKDDAVIRYREHLSDRIRDLIELSGGEVSEERFIQEAAILADKTDITEEIVRFHAHVVQLKNTLGEEGPIGRKLDFLLQEMNREANTMGSKGADLVITDRVVQLKCELEKIREQIQNIE